MAEWGRRRALRGALLLLAGGLSGCGGGAKTASVQRKTQAAASKDPASGAPANAKAKAKTLHLAEKDFAEMLRKTDAKYVVVTVFSAYCGPCLTESLQLEERRAAWKKQGVAVIGMGYGDEPEEIERFREQTGRRVHFPLYFAPWFAEKQHVEVLPTLFIYSSGGRQRLRADSSEHEDLPAWAGEQLKRLLAEAKP